jgi:hypothetical protein
MVGFGRAGPLTVIDPALGCQLGGLETAAQKAPHGRLGEGFHAAIGMVDHEPFPGAEQLVGNHQRPDRVVARAAAGIADHMGIALREAGIFRRIETRIHAGENGEPAGRRHGQCGLVADARGVGPIGVENVVANLAHWSTPLAEC